MRRPKFWPRIPGRSVRRGGPSAASLLSLLAAISGALTGAGPNFSLAAFGFRSLLVTHPP